MRSEPKVRAEREIPARAASARGWARVRRATLVLYATLAFGASAVLPEAASARRAPAPTPSPSPTDTPSPSPTPTLAPAARLERLRTELETLAREAPGRLGAAVYDITDDTRVAVRGDEAFPLASTAKLAVGLAAFRRADQGRLDLDARVLVSAADLRRGASEIAAQHPRGNVTLTYWQLIGAMLTDSDNTANDVLLGALGGPSAIQTFLTKLGTHGFRYRKSEAELFADARAGRTFARGGDNAGTPNGVADLLRELALGHYLSLDATNEMLLMLAASHTGDARLRAGLPPDASLAHKTGTSDTVGGVTDATNDAGILTLPDGRRIVIVAFLAGARGDASVRDAVLAAVAGAVYEAFGP
jgi:beta-lactamase class A